MISTELEWFEFLEKIAIAFEGNTSVKVMDIVSEMMVECGLYYPRADFHINDENRYIQLCWGKTNDGAFIIEINELLEIDWFYSLHPESETITFYQGDENNLYKLKNLVLEMYKEKNNES